MKKFLVGLLLLAALQYSFSDECHLIAGHTSEFLIHVEMMGFHHTPGANCNLLLCDGVKMDMLLHLKIAGSYHENFCYLAIRNSILEMSPVFPNIRKVSLTLSENFWTTSSIGFETAVNLNEIHLRDNNLTIISRRVFQNLRNLEWLNLPRNEIRNIESGSFQGLNNLKELCLQENQLENLAPKNLFESLVNLRSVNLSVNNFENVNVIFPGALEIADISYNRILYIDETCFSQTYNLKQLNLTNNNIAKFSSGLFSNVHSLEFLDISNNRIVIEFGTFSELENLAHLSVRGNGLKELSEIFYHDLKSLQTIDVSNNSLTSINASNLLQHSRYLDKIYINENPFPCPTLINLFEMFGEIAAHGINFSKTNVNGISCVIANCEESKVNTVAITLISIGALFSLALSALCFYLLMRISSSVFNR